MEKMIKCKNCNEIKPAGAKGLCTQCYHKIWFQQQNYKQRNAWRHESGRSEPMSINKKCMSHLGYFRCNKLMQFYFPGCIEMPYGNQGYSHQLNGAKYKFVSASLRTPSEYAKFNFHLRRNSTTDYFVFFGFISNENTKPDYMWIVKNSPEMGNKQVQSISLSRLDQWSNDRVMI